MGKVAEFSVGSAPPSIIALSSESRVYEIAPLSEAPIDEIDTAAIRTNSCALRVFATTSSKRPLGIRILHPAPNC